MATQKFTIEVSGNDTGECLEKIAAIKSLMELEGKILTGLSKNGIKMFNHPVYGKMIRNHLGIK